MRMSSIARATLSPNKSLIVGWLSINTTSIIEHDPVTTELAAAYTHVIVLRIEVACVCSDLLALGTMYGPSVFVDRAAKDFTSIHPSGILDLPFEVSYIFVYLMALSRRQPIQATTTSICTLS